MAFDSLIKWLKQFNFSLYKMHSTLPQKKNFVRNKLTSMFYKKKTKSNVTNILRFELKVSTNKLTCYKREVVLGATVIKLK